MIIVGSVALEYFGYNRRKPLDIDYWVSPCETPPSEGDCSIIPFSVLENIPTKDGYATPDAVYTIKCSHLGWDVHWQKTKLDILHLKHKGCTLVADLYPLLVEHWKGVHGDKSYLSLMKDKTQFFTDKVTYTYDHDYLHELVAHPRQPLYTTILKEGQKVLLDKDKFCKMSFEDKVRLFREEITTIAIERWLTNPHWSGKVSWYQSYMWSLKKTVTRLTKNWAIDFIALNLEEFVIPDYSYFKHTIETLNLGGSTMNTQEIKEYFVQLHNEYAKYYNEEHTKWSYDDSLQEFILNLCEGDVNREYLTDYEHLAQEGGGEGGAEYCYGVFRLGDALWKADYLYYSHNGHVYYNIEDTLKQVTPKEKKITVYE